MDYFQNGNLVPPALASRFLSDVDGVDTNKHEMKLPAALGNALDRNPDAKAAFANLPDGRKRQILQRSQEIHNRRGMDELMKGLSEASFD